MRCSALLLCCLIPLVQADDLGLQPVDERGCILGHGTIQAPTLTLMAAAYGESEQRNAVALAKIEEALDAGCPIDAVDQVGLSALNGAILYNEPVLVKLLLARGADPQRRIVSTSGANGLDSFAFLDLLQQRDKQRDRSAIKALLTEHGAQVSGQ